MKLISLQFAIVALLCMCVLATMVVAQYHANEATLFEDETFNQFYNGENQTEDDEDNGSSDGVERIGTDFVEPEDGGNEFPANRGEPW